MDLTHLGDDDFVDWTVLQHCWPDFMTFKFDDEGNPVVLFIIQRSRNRQLNADREAMVKMLELLGLNVRIRLPEGVLLTLQEFKQGAAISRTTTTLARQTIYQYRSHVKQMKAELERLAEDDPKRTALQNQIRAKEWLIQESTPPPNLQKEVEQAKVEFTPENQRNPFGFTDATWDKLILNLVKLREQGKELSPKVLQMLEWYDIQQAKKEVFNEQEEQKTKDREAIEQEIYAKLKAKGIDLDQPQTGGNTPQEGAEDGGKSV